MPFNLNYLNVSAYDVNTEPFNKYYCNFIRFSLTADEGQLRPQNGRIPHFFLIKLPNPLLDNSYARIPVRKKEATEDQQRWTAFIGGDRNALGALFDAYARQLLVYGYRICGSKTMAKDAIQDVFVDIWLYRANLAPEVQVKFYLYRSLRRALLKQMAATRPLGTDEWETITDPQPSPETDWVVSETESQRSNRLLQSLNVLSDREREVISLKYFSDLKIRRSPRCWNCASRPSPTPCKTH